MLVKRSDLFTLRELSLSRGLVSLEKIPPAFKSEFDKFFFGKTLFQDENKRLYAYPHDIKRWVTCLVNVYKD